MNAPVPASNGPQARRAVVLAVVILGVVLAAFHWQWGWGYFDLFSFKPWFADTVALLAAGQARHAGLDVYAHNPLDPFHRPHVYGPGWLVSGGLGLTVADATWIGPLLVAIFLVVAAAVVAPRRWRDLPLGLALLLSPPVMLGIERANNDLVIFLLLALAGWLLARRLGWMAAGGALLGLAATQKMYPFAALPVLALAGTRRRPAILLLAAVSAACVAALWIWRDDYRRALQNTPQPETIFAYGAAVTAMMWHGFAGMRAWYVVGLAAGAVVVVTALATRTRRLWSCVPPQGFSALAFLLGATCWLFCFVAASNFPYRAVLLLLPARLWLEQVADATDCGTARLQLWLWALACWLEVPKATYVPLAQARPPGTSPAWGTLEFICGLEQGLIALLSLALAISVLGAFVRWWCDRPAETAAPVTAAAK